MPRPHSPSHPHTNTAPTPCPFLQTQLSFTEADLDSIHFDATGEIYVEDHFVDLSNGKSNDDDRERRAFSDQTPEGFTGASEF